VTAGEITSLEACVSAAVAAQRAHDAGFPLVALAQTIATLGNRELALSVAMESERGPVDPPPADWFAMLAVVHAILGSRRDVDRLATRAEQQDPVGSGGQSSLVLAYEHLADAEHADAALLRVPCAHRALNAAEAADIALDAGRVTRAEALERMILDDDLTLARLRIRLAHARAAAGDASGARAWLDRAAELAGNPAYFQPNVSIALAAAELGDADRALALADAVDRATYEHAAPYGAPEHVELARVYAALGRHAKVDQILAGFAAVHAKNTASGFATTARAYAVLGRMEGARKLATRAEGKLGRRDSLGHLVLTRTYLLLGDFARATDHARKITDYIRVDALVEIARAAYGRSIEETPEIAAELAKL
jgi:tetratricopeptide (TPR) repeat protein